MSGKRTAHPYFMYEAIGEQPERITALARAQRHAIEAAAEAAATRRRILFVGIGTSSHAAQIGEHFLRHFSAGAAHCFVEQSFELVHYPLQLSADDALVVISHRGWKNYSVQALRTAQAARALTIAVTGEPVSEGMRSADHVIVTCEQENSFAHTKSYTTALAALAMLAICVAERRGQIASTDRNKAIAAVERIPEMMRAALTWEAHIREAAKQLAMRQRCVFIGAGPNWATAREAALKMKEACYLATEGFQCEQFLHGPIAELDSRAALVGLIAGGPGDHRINTALRAAGELGVLRIASASRGAISAEQSETPAEFVFDLPEVSEWLSPFVHAVPMQLLSYFVALERHTNPDTGRQDQPAHARAHELFTL